MRIQNLNERSEDVLNSGASTTLVGSSIDGLGDVVTLYFDSALDVENRPIASQFAVLQGVAEQTVQSVEVSGNQVRLKLASALATTGSVQVSYRDVSVQNDAKTLQTVQGADAADFRGVEVQNRLSLQGTGSELFAQSSTLTLAGAEISAFDPLSDRLFVTSSKGLQVLKVNADLSMTPEGTLALGSNDINSVAVKNGLVAVAVAAKDKTQPGSVFFLNATANLSVDQAGVIASAGFVEGEVTVGALPDMLVFTADGNKVLVANEGERNTPADIAATPPKSSIDPEGSVSIIDLSAVLAPNAPDDALPSVTTATFTAFNAQRDALKAEGVRLFAGETGFETLTVAQDLEPEYIAISPDGRQAFVTLQENNAIGILDMASGQFTDVVPLGLKSFLGLPFDGSDRDGAGNAVSTSLQTDQPVVGLYMPDAIASFVGADGKSYYLIANEGDDRDDFLEPDETIRVNSASYNLDDARFPSEVALKTNGEIGRLTVSNAPGNRGDIDGDGDIDRITAYGARSFSILDAGGAIVFDSGSHLEQFFAAGGVFNTASPAAGGLFDDTRSDNKGPEPEGITVGRVGDKTLAFVGLERGGGGVMIYDVSNPMKTSFVQYVRNPADVSPEGLSFVPAEQSPSGQDVLFVTNEVSMSVTAFRRMPSALSKIGTFSTGVYNESAAEIVAHDPATQRLFLVNALAAEVQVVSIANPAEPTLIGKIDLSNYGGQVNSVAVQGGRVAVAVAASDPVAAGKVVVFSADIAVSATAAAPAGAVAFAAGVGPDMLTFSPDGKKILVANEAESIGATPLTVANGGITIITLGADAATALSAATVQQLDFTAYNGKEGWLRERGVRILAGASASDDLEPEYIAVSPDGSRAWVTLQENSAFAVLDISKAPATIVDIVPMGLKDHARGDLVMSAYDELRGSELASIGVDAFGDSVPTGGFSGLQYLGKDSSGNLRFLTVSDRGPNGEPINVDTDAGLERPFLLPDYQARVSELEFDPSTGKMSVVSTMMLTKPDGSKLTGLPNIPGVDEEPVQIVPADSAQKSGTFTDKGVTYGYRTLSYDPLGADLEGVYRLGNGTMWMVDEYRPAVYEFDADGKMLSRYVPAGTAALTADTGDNFGTETLPAHLSKRQANRGFEALAVDEAGGYLYAFVQSPLDAVSGSADTAGPLVRIVKLAIRDLTVDGAPVSKGTVAGEYAYLLERPALRLGQLDKIGDAVFNAEAGTIFVFERDSDVGLESKKVLYEIDLRGATNLKTATLSMPAGKTALEELSVDEMLAAGVNPVYKAVVGNLSSTGYMPNDKAEGLALLPRGVLSAELGLAVINDNDFGVNGDGTETIGLGLLSFNGANDLDADDDDGINIAPAPVYGAFMPDAIAAFKVGGKTYYITANEGDSRDVDVVKVSAAAPLVDASAQDELAKLDAGLELVKDAGDIDGDGDLDRLVAFGGRSFSIYDSLGNRIYDSGDALERLIAEVLPNNFNASNAASSSGNKLDNRSDNKGPEPEAVTTAEIDGKVYAFIGLERVGGVAVVEVTDPYHPQLLSYTNSRDFSKTELAAGDLGPEGIIVIAAAASPNGKPLVVVANEVSGTLGLYDFGPMSPTETDPTVWLNTAFSTSLAPSQGVIPV
jgi:DNA-binding beta-propeller fold protein YncE